MDKMSQEALAVKRAEQAFDRKRRTIGLFGAPILALLVFFTPIAGLTLEAHKLLAIMVLVALWWITEPVPIPVTSLIGPLWPSSRASCLPARPSRPSPIR